MGETRMNLGLAGPGNQYAEPDNGAPYAHCAGDVTVSDVPVLFWRFRAPTRMVASDIVLYCAAIACTDGQMMVEAYVNGQYTAEVPLRQGGTGVDAPILIEKLDLVELRLGRRGAVAGDATAKDVWILFTSRKA